MTDTLEDIDKKYKNLAFQYGHASIQIYLNENMKRSIEKAAEELNESMLKLAQAKATSPLPEDKL